MTTYEQKKERILQLYSSAITFAQKSQYREYVKLLQDAMQRLNDGKFMVVVCGEFRRGKSSLLNAFLDELQDLFPVDLAITTNLVSTITYGPQEKIIALVGPPDSDDLQEIHIKRDELRNYVTEKGNPRNAREAQLVKLEMPKEQLKQGLVLVDTPGVGGLYKRHTDVTYQFIPNADAVLFVSDVFQPLTQEDLTFIKDRILPHTEYIIFVLAKKDREKDYQIIVENTRQKLVETLGWPANTITIIPVSSHAKRHYLKTRDPEDLADSNFPQLEQVLWQFVGARRGRILLARALTILGKAVAEMRRPLQVAYDTCREQNKRKLAEMESSLQEAREHVQQLQESGAYWQTQLRDGLEDIRHDALYNFNRNYGVIRRNAEIYLRDDSLIEQPERLLGPVQRDIDDLLYALDRFINQAAADLQAHIEYATGLSLNPFTANSLTASSKALALQNLPQLPQPSSEWDEMVTVGQRANATGSFGEKVAGAIGWFFGAIFGAPKVGHAIGSGIGYLLGARSGAKQSMQQVRERSRQQIREQLMMVISDSQQEQGNNLSRTIRDLERGMRDELLSKIRREKQSRERALRAFQESRNLTVSQANERLAALKGPLQQLDQLQGSIETLVQETMAHADDPVVPPSQRPEFTSKTNTSSSSTTSGSAGATDKGEWADG